MPEHVRVRIAPSPTGLIHIGTIRSVLFNYLMARHYDGTFILRIEDTDRARIHADGVSNILEILEWLDFTPDEGPGLGGDKGPYIQSERLPIYQKWANFLLESGHAYYADLSEDIISAHKQLCQENKQAFVFRLEDFESSIDTTPKPNTPIRLKVPRKKGSVQWEDMLRGTYETPFNLIEDMVLIKADGYPTYNFANVVDDHLMEITHIIRGDEFLSSSPKHQLLYDLLGFKAPVFMHLPPINGNNGKKLSKREADVSMQSYKEAGFLPEAIINYLAFQGWTPGSDDIYTLDQLIARFDYRKSWRGRTS
jgi:glutamyl-tRNA synthetase